MNNFTRYTTIMGRCHFAVVAVHRALLQFDARVSTNITSLAMSTAAACGCQYSDGCWVMAGVTTPVTHLGASASLNVSISMALLHTAIV
jgi:hypothetical protein